MIESISERMKAVAEMLGVEIDEEFDIAGYAGNPHKITERGLFNKNSRNRNDLLAHIITGEVLITKRPKAPAEPWKPKEGERYWYVIPDGTISHTSYVLRVSPMDAFNYRIGNCFPDRETAEANKDIMLQKFNTPELIPASWTPEHGETYWIAPNGVPNGVPIELCWGGDTLDYSYKVTGNLYRTEAEALADYPNLRKRLGMPEVDA